MLAGRSTARPPADYVRVVEHRKLKVAPKTTRKARKKVLDPRG